MKPMKTLNDLLDEIKRISRDIRNIQKACGYDDCDDLSRLDIPKGDPESLFLWDELRGVMDKLADAQAAVEYLSSPVQTEGVLRKAKNGRYASKTWNFRAECPLKSSRTTTATRRTSTAITGTSPTGVRDGLSITAKITISPGRKPCR